MNLNMHIIIDELKILKPLSYINDSISLTLNKVRILKDEQISIEENCLYLSESSIVYKRLDELKGSNLICIDCVELWIGYTK